MRRSEREIKDPVEISKILSEGFVCHLGLAEGDQPYVVPLNYAYVDGVIYFHCASEGRKLDIIRKNNKVCFEVEITSGRIVRNTDEPCSWGTAYRSVIGTGTAVLVNDTEEKRKGLKAIVATQEPRDLPFHEQDFSRTAVIRIDIAEMTGKAATE